jgi:hypothetical protein
MEAARNPATSIFHGGTGMMAATMRVTGPIQVIIGLVSTTFRETGPMCIMTPMEKAIVTR